MSLKTAPTHEIISKPLQIPSLISIQWATQGFVSPRFHCLAHTLPIPCTLLSPTINNITTIHTHQCIHHQFAAPPLHHLVMEKGLGGVHNATARRSCCRRIGLIHAGECVRAYIHANVYLQKSAALARADRVCARRIPDADADADVSPRRDADVGAHTTRRAFADK